MEEKIARLQITVTRLSKLKFNPMPMVMVLLHKPSSKTTSTLMQGRLWQYWALTLWYAFVGLIENQQDMIDLSD